MKAHGILGVGLRNDAVVIYEDIGADGFKRHERPEYTMHQAQQVVNWLNGNDRPLKMVPRHMDSWDPAIRYPLKKPRRRR